MLRCCDVHGWRAPVEYGKSSASASPRRREKNRGGSIMTLRRSEPAAGRPWRLGALVASALLLLGAAGTARADDLPTVKIAVGGASCLCYLPTMLAEQLGNFKKAGVQVELADFKGGSQAEAAVIGGSSDVVSGFYDHTVVLQPKQKFLQSIVVFDRFPGLVLMVSPGNTDKIKTVKDLVGKKVGVSAPGSSTDFFLKYLLRKIGEDPTQASVVGIGNGAPTVAAMQQNQVDAGVLVEPAPTVLQSKY